MKKVKKKQKGKQQQKISEWEWFGDRLTHIYLLFMLAVFPAFYTNKLFHLTDDKEGFFYLFTITYLCLLLPAFLGEFVEFVAEKKFSLKWDTVCIMLLAAGILLTACLAEDMEKVMLQMSSRTVSGMVFLLCGVMYLYVRRFAVTDKVIQSAWLAGSAIIYLFGILCACKINFLYIQDGVSSPAINLTPLGNTNFNACYVCLMLAFSLGMYVLCEDRLFQKLYAANVYMGFLFMHFIKTESSMIAIIIGLAVLAFFAVEKAEWFEKYLQIAALYLGAKVTIGVIRHFFAEHIYPFEGLGAVLLRWEIVLIEIVILLLVYLGSRKSDGLLRIIAGARKYIFFVSVLGLAGMVVLIAAVNLGWIKPDEGSVLNRLFITDALFNHRGFIWKKTCILIKEESPIQWLFGNGANQYGAMLKERFGEECREYFGATLNDPHNEFLQTFMDMGLVGIISYYGLLIGSLARAIKTWKINGMQMVVALTLVVYLVQGLANCYSVYHLPLLFIFLGFANGKAMNNQV
ncbi:MAG: O-antigen ligase family protein [Lachnospiraceae bacterium]|nr:O-antigen ligase family protein [Lachnospiraceae bacterium]